MRRSFSTVVGLAVEQGLIHSVLDTVAQYIPPIEVYDPAAPARTAEDLGRPQFLYPFASPHNRLLTWDVMLRQTSDWEGARSHQRLAQAPAAGPEDLYYGPDRGLEHLAMEWLPQCLDRA